MSRNVIETVMGGVVLLVAGLFLVFAYSSSDIRDAGGYEVLAKFNSVDGIGAGTDVRLSGIKVGSVTSQTLDPETYLAELRLNLDDSVKLPTDTVAKIQSDGLLGNNYVALEPGAEDQMIEAGGEIRYTQDPVNITDLIGRFMFSAPNGPPPGSPPAPSQGSGSGSGLDLLPSLDEPAAPSSSGSSQ
jgi:phospholipid/cholesterol/gamma-HCH transport system substrate-binding protein